MYGSAVRGSRTISLLHGWTTGPHRPPVCAERATRPHRHCGRKLTSPFLSSSSVTLDSKHQCSNQQHERQTPEHGSEIVQTWGKDEGLAADREKQQCNDPSDFQRESHISSGCRTSTMKGQSQYTARSPRLSGAQALTDACSTDCGEACNTDDATHADCHGACRGASTDDDQCDCC